MSWLNTGGNGDSNLNYWTWLVWNCRDFLVFSCCFRLWRRLNNERAGRFILWLACFTVVKRNTRVNTSASPMIFGGTVVIKTPFSPFLFILFYFFLYSFFFCFGFGFCSFISLCQLFQWPPWDNSSRISHVAKPQSVNIDLTFLLINSRSSRIEPRGDRWPFWLFLTI